MVTIYVCMQCLLEEVPKHRDGYHIPKLWAYPGTAQQVFEWGAKLDEFFFVEEGGGGGNA